MLKDIHNWESASTTTFFYCWPLNSFSGAIGIILNPSSLQLASFEFEMQLDMLAAHMLKFYTSV